MELLNNLIILAFICFNQKWTSNLSSERIECVDEAWPHWEHTKLLFYNVFRAEPHDEKLPKSWKNYQNFLHTAFGQCLPTVTRNKRTIKNTSVFNAFDRSCVLQNSVPFLSSSRSSEIIIHNIWKADLLLFQYLLNQFSLWTHVCFTACIFNERTLFAVEHKLN